MSTLEQIGSSGVYKLSPRPSGAGGAALNDNLDALVAADVAAAAAIAGKAPTSHTHAIADVTSLQTTLDGKAATTHTHAQSDVIGLITALAGKAATTHTHAIADTTGFSTEAAERFKLMTEGATAAQLADAKAAEEQLEALKEKKKHFDEMTQAAKKLAEDIKTPFEKMNEELDKIADLEMQHFITPEQAARAAERAAEEFERAAGPRAGKTHDHHVKNFFGDKTPGLERRFTKGFTVEIASPWQKLLAENKRNTKFQESIAKNTAAIVTNLTDEIATIY